MPTRAALLGLLCCPATCVAYSAAAMAAAAPGRAAARAPPAALLASQAVRPQAARGAMCPRRSQCARMASRFRVRDRVRGALRSARLGVMEEPSNALIQLSGWYESRTGRGDGDEDAPAVLQEDICLVPGQPIVRVEDAPGNARRIFTGIDIIAEGCENVTGVVWNVLTDYPNLADPVPNLVDNKVVDRYCGGARLEQVGAAKIAPLITFKATTTLDVREWPAGLPADMEADHLSGEEAVASSKSVRDFGNQLPLQRGVFPRPYSLSSIEHADITMQGVQGEGDFSFYQGVWRCQPLPGCAPPGSSAMRLTYSVELSPRAWVPVALLEGRIAITLGENLESIRSFVEAPENFKRYATQQPAD